MCNVLTGDYQFMEINLIHKILLVNFEYLYYDTGLAWIGLDMLYSCNAINIKNIFCSEHGAFICKHRSMYNVDRI